MAFRRTDSEAPLGGRREQGKHITRRGRPLRRVLANYVAALRQLLELSPPSAHTRESRSLQADMLLFDATPGVSSYGVALGGPMPTPAGS